MKTCKKCNASMFDIDINKDDLCEKCFGLEKAAGQQNNDEQKDKIAKCKECGEEIKMRYLSPEFLCYKCDKEIKTKQESTIINKLANDNLSCSGCGISLSKGVNFCNKCGKKIEKVLVKDVYCTNCGVNNTDGENFCHGCGKQTTQSSVAIVSDTKTNPIITNIENGQIVIKCGNCAYEGVGESNRSIVGRILAWLCVIFAPMITIIYFVATHKYRCPKCKSTFLGVKNQHGVFVGQSGSNRVLIIVVCVLVGIAVIGLLSTLATVALGSARIKARDSKRLSDLKQIQVALELYHIDVDQNSYPTGNGVSLGSGKYACLNIKGWQPKGCSDPYMGVIPIDPSVGEYVYTEYVDSYAITATLEGNMNGLEGQITLTPDGIK